MFELTILSPDTKEGFYRLIREYLPDCNTDKIKSREAEFPKAYLTLTIDGEVVGVAFGWPRRLDDPADSSLCLQGLAVKEEYQRRGYGTRLLAEFEKAAGAYRCSSVSVGSAGGYVEDFYRKAGYSPVCYKVYRDSAIETERVFESLEDYLSYERKNPDGFVVMEKMSYRVN